MQEQRIEPRVTDSIAIDHWPAKTIFINSSATQNISLSGACFPALQRFEPQTNLGLNLYLPGFVEPINVDAQVVWIREIEHTNNRYSHGVRFTKILPTDMPKLSHYVFSKLESEEILH